MFLAYRLVAFFHYWTHKKQHFEGAGSERQFRRASARNTIAALVWHWLEANTLNALLAVVESFCSETIYYERPPRAQHNQHLEDSALFFAAATFLLRVHISLLEQNKKITTSLKLVRRIEVRKILRYRFIFQHEYRTHILRYKKKTRYTAACQMNVKSIFGDTLGQFKHSSEGEWQSFDTNVPGDSFFFFFVGNQQGMNSNHGTLLTSIIDFVAIRKQQIWLLFFGFLRKKGSLCNGADVWMAFSASNVSVEFNVCINV